MKNTKKYCAICGSSHEDDLPCFSAGEQAARDMRRPGAGGKADERELAKADASAARVTVYALIVLLLFILGGWFVFKFAV